MSTIYTVVKQRERKNLAEEGDEMDFALKKNHHLYMYIHSSY